MQIESGQGRRKEIRSEEEGGERLAIVREGKGEKKTKKE